MKHIITVTKLARGEVERTGLSVAQILTLLANILSVIAQALNAKEGTSTSTST